MDRQCKYFRRENSIAGDPSNDNCTIILEISDQRMIYSQKDLNVPYCLNRYRLANISKKCLTATLPKYSFVSFWQDISGNLEKYF